MTARRARSRAIANFYGAVVDRAERAELDEAAGIEGLDDEVALLRVRLRRALRDRPEDYGLMIKGIALLVRAVSARYRLSPAARRDLADSLADTLDRLGRALFPETAGGGT